MARTQSSTRTHRTGYLIFVFGDRYWHRTLQGAERRMIREQSWASGHIQIINLATGEMVAGWRA